MEPTPSRWRQAALAVVILSAAALALVWVFLVPIYQAPDEPMNLDYALAINAHGGLFRPASASFDSLPSSVHPHTAYLEQRCRTGAVAFHPTVKMPPEYGTWSGFVALDREAPPAGEVTGPNKPFAVYPFGYYTLVAPVGGPAAPDSRWSGLRLLRGPRVVGAVVDGDVVDD